MYVTRVIEGSCYTEVVAATLGKGQLPATAAAVQGQYFALHAGFMFPFSFFSFESSYIAAINQLRGCLSLAVTVICLLARLLAWLLGRFRLHCLCTVQLLAVLARLSLTALSI